MYKIKQKPEDFIVKELSNVEFVMGGNNAVFLLKKINHNTIDVIKKIAGFLGIKDRQPGYAGLPIIYLRFSIENGNKLCFHRQ